MKNTNYLRSSTDNLLIIFEFMIFRWHINLPYQLSHPKKLLCFPIKD